MVNDIPIDKKKRNKRNVAWRKENIKQYALPLHKEHDKVLIEHIENNKPASKFLKRLVQNDYERTKKD